MPFIDTKLTQKLTDPQKELIKSRMGEAIKSLNKTEDYLMVGIVDGYDLYFGGKKLEKGAYVEVSLLGSAPSAAYEKMTEQICWILDDVLGIPGKAVYVTYHGLQDRGWNGSNF